MRLYGCPGCGSAIVEGVLALAGVPVASIDLPDFEADTPDRARLLRLNPLGQVPVLVLDDGTVLTESAAICLFLADAHPGLAPAPSHPDRARFLRLLVWLVANVYPTFTYGDDPARWTPDAPGALRSATDAYRLGLYRWLETQVEGPFALGAHPGILDVYLAIMTAWRPRMAWFETHTPKIAAIALQTRALPALRPVCTRNAIPTGDGPDDHGIPSPTPP